MTEYYFKDEVTVGDLKKIGLNIKTIKFKKKNDLPFDGETKQIEKYFLIEDNMATDLNIIICIDGGKMISDFSIYEDELPNDVKIIRCEGCNNS